MENRQLAKLIGALCLEERLRIISDLIVAGEEGLTQLELSKITGLNPNTLSVHLGSMINSNLIKTDLIGHNKFFISNFELLEELFVFLNENYGAGVRLANRAAGIKASSTESKTA